MLPKWKRPDGFAVEPFLVPRLAARYFFFFAGAFFFVAVFFAAGFFAVFFFAAIYSLRLGHHSRTSE